MILYHFKGIRQKFFLMTIIAVIIVTFIFALSYSLLARDVIINMVHNGNLKQVEVYSVIVGNWFQERLNEIELYANNPVIKSMDWDKIELYLRGEMKRKSDIYTVLFVGEANGDYNTNLLRNAGNLRSREYFSRVMEGERTLSAPLISISTGEEIAVAAVPIKNDNEEVVGLMGGSISLGKLKKFIELFNINEINNYSYVVDKNGNIILQPQEDLIMRKAFGNAVRIIQREISIRNEEILNNNEKGKFTYGYKGEENSIYYHTIPNTDEWRIIYEVPTHQITQPMKDLYILFLITGIMVVVGGIIFSRYFSYKNTRPIIELKEVFDKAAKGDLAVRSKTDYPDELGEAGKSFNIMMDKISSLTYYDHITNLPNRDYFIQKLESEISHSKKNSKKFSIVLIAPIKLKRMNDMYGFEAVNKLLKNIGYRLKKARGHKNKIARISEEEFVVLFPEIISETEVIKGIKEMLKDLNRIFEIDNQKISANYNAGIVFYPTDGETTPTLLMNAGIAMSKAMEEGNNNYRIYNENMNQKLQEELILEKDLHKGIENKEFKLQYQPFIDIRTGKIVEVEALLRWHHPTKGIIPPLKFIPIAEGNELIIPIGEQVLKDACRQNKLWQDMGYKPITISVNISVIQFKREGFVETIASILKDTGLDPQYLGIEITEGMAMKDIDMSIEKLHKLKEIGVKISIDDFGTGFSSLSYFSKYPIDILKIDRSFIQNIEKSHQSRTIISTIISMSRALGIENVAEGIETEEQLDFIKTLNCHKAQGYFFSKPIDVGELEKLLAEDRKFC